MNSWFNVGKTTVTDLMNLVKHHHQTLNISWTDFYILVQTNTSVLTHRISL